MAGKRKPIKSNSVTPAQVDKFFAALAATANVVFSAKAAKISHSHVYDLRKEDPEFAARWDNAENVGTDSAEGEAFRRAVRGVLKPVYQQGKKVGTIREYSDALLALLLKARRPEKFKDKASVDHNVKGEVAHVLCPRSEELLSKLLNRGPHEEA